MSLITLRGYGIAQAPTLLRLMQEVNKMMHTGYIPVGGVFILPGALANQLLFGQALFINVELPKEDADKLIAEMAENDKKLVVT